MTMDLGEVGWQAAQLLGAGMILGAYVLLQSGTLGARSRRYLALNVLGAGTLAIIALLESLWGFLLLEGTWTLVSVAALVRTYLHPAQVES
jgi:hypothetical protein